jgi:hypothetical protein
MSSYEPSLLEERPLPHSAEAERTILGSVLLDNALVNHASELLRPEDFYVRAHQFVFRAMTALSERGSEIDPLLLSEELRREGVLEQAGGMTFISELTYGLPYFINVAAYAKLVKDHSLMRQLVKVANKITSEALESEDEAVTVLAHARSLIDATEQDYSLGAGGRGAALSVVRMADVAAEVVRWLWHPYIALGKFTLLEGDPGLGKSWLTCALAAAVTIGRGLPSAQPFEPGNVLMLSAEDGLGDTLRPRLDAVGADVSRVFAPLEPFTLDTAGLRRLEATVVQYSPKLAIVDPLFAFTGGKVDINRANECRAISAPLAAIAERTGCALVAVRHLGKSRGGGHALNAGIGSIDFTAAARSVLLVGQDPDEPSKRAIVQTKNNLAPHGKAVGYKLEDGSFYWTGASDLTAGRILAAVDDEEERGSIADAVDFLRVALSDGGRDAKAVESEAKQAGVNPATLRRAKTRLGVRSHKVGMPGTHYQKWVWELPAAEGAQPAPEDAQENRVEHLRASDVDKGGYGNNLPEGAQVLEFEHLRQRVEHLRTEVPDEMEFRQRVAVLVGGGVLDEESAREFESLAHDPATRAAFARRYMGVMEEGGAL